MSEWCVCSASHGHPSGRPEALSERQQAGRAPAAPTPRSGRGHEHRGEVVGLDRAVELHERQLAGSPRRRGRGAAATVTRLVGRTVARGARASRRRGRDGRRTARRAAGLPDVERGRSPSARPSTTRAPVAIGSTPSAAHAASANDSPGTTLERGSGRRARRRGAARRCAPRPPGSRGPRTRPRRARPRRRRARRRSRGRAPRSRRPRRTRRRTTSNVEPVGARARRPPDAGPCARSARRGLAANAARAGGQEQIDCRPVRVRRRRLGSEHPLGQSVAGVDGADVDAGGEQATPLALPDPVARVDRDLAPAVRPSTSSRATACTSDLDGWSPTRIRW